MEQDVQAQLADLSRRVQELEGKEASGNWVPEDGSGAGLSLTIAAATWMRWGQMVVANFSVTYPVTANTAVARIANLPFKSENQGSNSHAVAISFHDFGAPLYAFVEWAWPRVLFSDQAGAILTNAQLSGKRIRGTAIYRTRK